MTNKVESFGKVDDSKNRPKSRPGCVKLIRNGLRKEQNLIKSRPSMAETGLAGRENRVDSRKRSRRDRIMRSKSFSKTFSFSRRR